MFVGAKEGIYYRTKLLVGKFEELGVLDFATAAGANSLFISTSSAVIRPGLDSDFANAAGLAHGIRSTVHRQTRNYFIVRRECSILRITPALPSSSFSIRISTFKNQQTLTSVFTSRSFLPFIGNNQLSKLLFTAFANHRSNLEQKRRKCEFESLSCLISI